ncbi:response regulator [Actinospica robiniae]|uniref:response regulator n=1 Tax=Actinospica robiniae TaxID=304901 RepID=UPI0006870DFA|nr:response regulator transcription factor [Actinospica robiniae]
MTEATDQTGSTRSTDTPPIRVLTADDQRVVREGLAMLLGLMPGVEVVGAAKDGLEVLQLAASARPDVVLMDLRMPHCDGIEATRRLREQYPEIKVIALTTYADDRSVLDALRAGARGYLTKDSGAAEIHQALQTVVEDRSAIDPAVQHHLVAAIAAPAQPTAGAAPAAPPAPAGLTPRELEVLALIAAGLTNAEIAGRLFVSEGTVKSHINHLLTKIGARDRAQAVSYAYRHGLAGTG